MTRYQKARAWRKRHNLTIARLAELTGYGPRAIMWLEKGQSPPGPNRSKPGTVPDWVWLRYKRMCQGVDAELRTGQKFEW